MIEFDGVAVHYGDRAVVADVTLTVERGRTTVLLGRSGSGKTTLLRLINRLLVPTVGDVRVDGTSTRDWDPIRLRRRTGYVIQEAGLLPHYTVARNIGLVPALQGWAPERIERRVRELLAFVGLDREPADVRDPDTSKTAGTADGADIATRLPHQLSGGQRQRVGVARALAADPPVLLCDEPFAALDPITRGDLQREFKALAARLGKTIVFVTHDVREALYLGDRIVLLDGGRVAVDADVDEFAASDHPEARAFLASLEPAP